MLQLLKLHGSIISNYAKFQANKDNIDLLKENITLFSAVDEHKLKKALKTVSANDLQRCNEALLIMAKSYTEYAFATLDNNAQNFLENAEQCYKHVTRSIGQLPARSLTSELGTQNSAAEFYKLQIQFDKARLKLTFLSNAEQVESKLIQKIINVCERFESQLRHSYKDSAFQADTPALLCSINLELEKAKQLLASDKVQKTKRKFQDSPKPQKKEQKRAKKAKPTPRHKQEDDPNLVDVDTVKQTVPETHHRLEELATTATFMHSFFCAPKAPVANKVSLSLPQPQEIAFEIQNTIRKNYVVDSKKCNNWVTEWEEENGRSHTLEMLGYALLEAALLLQRKSATYRNQKTNPAIQFAVKFLLMSITHTNNPTEEQRELSEAYCKLLKPFTRFKIIELAPQYYLEHLRTHFTTHDNMSSFHNLSSQEMVDTLFKTLASMCSAEDYELITSACFNSLNVTTEGYTQDTCFTF